jgi:hypothetical protein
MPHRWNGNLVAGDPRFGTRWASPSEISTAQKALQDLEENQNRIVLVPAPSPCHSSHKIRMQESRNPQWYVDFGRAFWRSPRNFQLKRSRVIRALKRVADVGIIRRNGYESKLLSCLEQEAVLCTR